MTDEREEVGPWLGVLASPRSRPLAGGLVLDDIRLALVSSLLQHRGGDARTWLDAWAVAAAAVTRRLKETIDVAVNDAASRSLAPERMARQARPDDDDLRVISARIESAGIPLEQAAARPTLSRLGGAAEESWLELERVASAVLAEWRAPVQRVATWRRPVAPLWILSAGLLALAVLVGLMIGGYLPAPSWFQPITDWWWRLPWP